MSWQAQAMAWAIPELSPSQRLVLLAMANHANEFGENMHPGNDRLAQLTGLAEKTIRSAITDLASRGLVFMTRASTGRGRANVYRMPIDMGLVKTHYENLPREKGGNSSPVSEDVKGVPSEAERGQQASGKGVNPCPPTPELINQDKSQSELTLGDKRALAPAKPPVTEEMLDAAVLDWNHVAIAHGLSQARKLTGWRRRRLLAILTEIGPDGWSNAVERIPRSRFMLGQSRSGYRATLKSVLGEDVFQTLAEGGYDDHDWDPGRTQDRVLRAGGLTPAGDLIDLPT